MLVSGVILALYFWAYFTVVTTPIASALLVDDVAAMIAGAALLTSFVSYLWAPQKYSFWGTYAAYALLSALAIVLILNTGGVNSPFIALWMLIGVFAGVFGWYGLAPLVLAATGYLLVQFTAGVLTRDMIITIVLAGELPLLVSYMLWHTKDTGDSGSDRAYRRLATELSQVANKSEVVINAIADGVVALNDKGVIQLINPAAQQIIGWGKQDAVALDYKSVLKILDKDGHEIEPATDPVASVLGTNKQILSSNFALMTNSNKKILVSLSISPVGQLGSGVIIVFRDITSEKAEEREQAEFISTASHEMRTPVATIEGYLGLALNPATAQIDEKAREFINKAHESAQHLGRLFSDLLDISKSEDGRLQNNPKVVDVVAFVQDVARGLRPQADAKGLRMLFKPIPDEGDTKNLSERRLNPVYYAKVDNDHLREVVSNLIENAIKYTPAGDVVIDIAGDAGHVVISVADSGIGIPKEDQSHLFQKFYRVDNTDTREIGGTGLGLYLSRRLAETMSGRIWVDSEYKQGSTFFLEVPRISHEDAMQSIEAVETPVAGPQIIPHPQDAMLSQPEQVNQPVSILEEVTAPVQAPTQSYQAPEPVSEEENENFTPMAPPFEQPQSQLDIQKQAYAAEIARQHQADVASQQQYLAQQRQAQQAQAPVQQPQPQQPYQQPQYQPQPQPAQTYAPQQPIAPQYSPASQPQYANTPLSHIEQNPEQYVHPRDGSVSVAPRSQ